MRVFTGRYDEILPHIELHGQQANRKTDQLHIKVGDIKIPLDAGLMPAITAGKYIHDADVRTRGKGEKFVFLAAGFASHTVLLYVNTWHKPGEDRPGTYDILAGDIVDVVSANNVTGKTNWQEGLLVFPPDGLLELSFSGLKSQFIMRMTDDGGLKYTRKRTK